MSLKVIVLFALLTVALAERPYLGFRLPLSMPQIVGGSDAQEGVYRFIVSLQLGGRHYCAGSILSENWIITAAHCVQAVTSADIITVKAGKYNIRIKEETEQTVEVEKIFVHEQYGGGVGPYDIAVLKLKTPLTFGQRVQPVTLPKPESDPEGKAELCGWGSVSQSSFPKMPDKLQHAELPFVERASCYEAVRRLRGSSPVHETNVCTGPLTGGVAACSGDSGGPLFTYLNSNTILLGIVSWGIIPCGTIGAPSVYTRVSSFNGWIQQKTNLK